MVYKAYWIELATFENTVLELLPMRRIVPTTMMRITATITAYSAISWPASSAHNLRMTCDTLPSKGVEYKRSFCPYCRHDACRGLHCQ